MKANRITVLAASVLLTSCAGSFDPKKDVPDISPSQARTLVAALLPKSVDDRQGWARDIYAPFAALKIPLTTENFCSVIAVIAQESSFRADPRVPGLSKIAWKEIESRAGKLFIPKRVVRTALKVPSPTGKSFSDRIDRATTERELSEIYEDIIGYLPLGKTIFGSRNPVRTGGPMQVSIRYAEQLAKAGDYPYPVEKSVRREVHSRRGGLFFGIAHLLNYNAVEYDSPIYRYADFNAGHFASRNAAFQNAVSLVSGITLALDGDLLAYDRKGRPHQGKPGSTELAVRAIADQLKLSDKKIRKALEKGRGPEFSETRLYVRVFQLADAYEKRTVRRAMMPEIRLKSPKISRNLTTEWFASRVLTRQQNCLKRL